jgi:hypothetical protein
MPNLAIRMSFAHKESQLRKRGGEMLLSSGFSEH